MARSRPTVKEPEEAMKLDGLPHDRMLDLDGVGNALLGGITDVVFIREGLVDADVNVFVDSSRNKKAAELFVIRPQIGSSAANRNKKRSSHDNHRVILVEYSNKVSQHRADLAALLPIEVHWRAQAKSHL
jgi:hypothetical protein